MLVHREAHILPLRKFDSFSRNKFFIMDDLMDLQTEIEDLKIELSIREVQLSDTRSALSKSKEESLFIQEQLKSAKIDCRKLANENMQLQRLVIDKHNEVKSAKMAAWIAVVVLALFLINWLFWQ